MFAPTVPSEPSPQNLHDVIPSIATSISLLGFNDRLVTSSSIPIVNLFLGCSLFKFSYIATISEGYGSLEPRPYLPPITLGTLSISLTALSTSKYKGSPIEPGSLVLSKTAIFLTDFGIVFNSLSMLKGLYNLTLISPTFSPLFLK